MKVSKCVAANVLGEQAIEKYAAAQIAAGNDREKWEYFLNISDDEIPFDLLAATKSWVEKHRIELEKIRQSEVDFTQKEWWR